MAPEVLFRSQPHGTYKLFFNGLYLSVAPDRCSGQEAGQPVDMTTSEARAGRTAVRRYHRRLHV